MKNILRAAIADVNRDKNAIPPYAVLAYRPPNECPPRMHQFVCVGYVGTGILRYRCDRCGAWFDVDSSD